ncbi:MAG: DNA repair protein RecO, partial [Hydrogenovibrio sp.]
MAKDIEQLAFVLHRRAYRETSLLVTFFTADFGKQNAVVKGVRTGSRAAAAKQAWLQPFQGVNIGWRERQGRTSDLVALNHLESAQLRFPLAGEASVCGLYVNELLYRLLYPSLATDRLFEAYQQTLYDLAVSRNRSDQAWALRQFEYELLSELGVAFQIETDHRQQPLVIQQRYWFHPEQGLFAENDAALPTGMVGVWVTGDCLLKLAKGCFCEGCLR